MEKRPALLNLTAVRCPVRIPTQTLADNLSLSSMALARNSMVLVLLSLEGEAELPSSIEVTVSRVSDLPGAQCYIVNCSPA